MRYALLIYSEPDAMARLAPDELADISRQFWAVRDVPGCLDGGQLAPVDTATTLRGRDGTGLVTDGPFADTKEVLAGYYIVEAADLDAATAIAEHIPITRVGGSVEIRPLVEETRPVAG